MIFHVVGLPHTNTTSDFVVCAFTEKVRKFCVMMKGLGHTVYLYAGEFNEAPCDEHIVCITEAERLAHVGDKHYTEASFDYSLPVWQDFNRKVAQEIENRCSGTDFVCLIGGLANKQIADTLTYLTCVELGIGYGGTFARFRVWESYAWMHTCYGSANPNPNDTNGLFFDAVIPSYFEPEKFPFRSMKDDYFLYMGRLTERKGVQIAADVCEHIQEPLLVAGVGVPPSYGEYVGAVGEEERGKLMAGAKALFVPTQYIEPFGSVAVEAMLCGTPVISTDFGAMSETNIHGVTGYRCRTMGEFVWAAQNVEYLDRYEIHVHAAENYSLTTVAHQYQSYFEQLETLWGKGFYDMTPRRPNRTRTGTPVISR